MIYKEPSIENCLKKYHELDDKTIKSLDNKKVMPTVDILDTLYDMAGIKPQDLYTSEELNLAGAISPKRPVSNSNIYKFTVELDREEYSWFTPEFCQEQGYESKKECIKALLDELKEEARYE